MNRKPSHSSSSMSEGKQDCSSEYDQIADTASIFSHPERIGCPNPQLLIVFARSKRSLPQEMRNRLHRHLLQCVSCNKEYLAIRDTSASLVPKYVYLWPSDVIRKLAQTTTQIVTNFKSSRAFLQSSVRMSLIALAVFNLAVMTWFINTRLWVKNDQTHVASLYEATEQHEDSRGTIPNGSQDIQPNPATRTPHLSSNNPLPRRQAKDHNRTTLSQVRISLNDYVTLRGEGEASTGQHKPIKLRNLVTRFSFRIPKNSINGLYNVSILDPFGIALVSRRSISTRGSRLIIDFDLRQFVEGKYILSISREGEIPHYYPVVVVSR